jgi:uncharacterized membrane protein
VDGVALENHFPIFDSKFKESQKQTIPCLCDYLDICIYIFMLLQLFSLFVDLGSRLFGTFSVGPFLASGLAMLRLQSEQQMGQRWWWQVLQNLETRT